MRFEHDKLNIACVRNIVKQFQINQMVRFEYDAKEYIKKEN